MIKTFAELLRELKEKGIKEIEPFLNIEHNPTIGDMYEGLTKEILNKVVFQNIKLKVTSGKIKNNKGQLSRQIDCMIVVGEGQEIPFTDNFLYNINDVIAVVEVKKTFYSKDLHSGYNNLKSVADIFEPRESLEMSQVTDSYRSILGEDLPGFDKVSSLPFHKQLLYHSLILESYLPLRIVFGYKGFKNEYSLREGFINYLCDNKSEGYGPTNLPSLIVCDELTLIKLNGMPYSARVNNDSEWALYASYPRNSMIILLELIWTRLVYKYNLNANVFGSSFKVENINPFMFATAINEDKQMGWKYRFLEVSKGKLEHEMNKDEAWTPSIVSNTSFVIFNKLCHGLKVNFSDSNLINAIKSSGSNLKEIEKEVIGTGLVYRKTNGDLGLLTKECSCVIGPQGFLVGENVDGRMIEYIDGSKGK